MKLFKKAVSLLLSAAIIFSMMCVGSVSASADAGSKYVVTAQERDDGAFGIRIDITGDIKESLLVNLRSNILYNHTVTAEYLCENTSYKLIIYYRNRFPDTICYVGDQLTLDKNIMDYSWDTEFENYHPVSSHISLFSSVPEHIAELKTCYSVKFTCTTSHGLKTVFEDTVFISEEDMGTGTPDDSSDSSEESRTDISTLSFSKPADLIYSGKYRKSPVFVRENGKTLVKGRDYTLTYRNCKNIGTASITIKGIGNYTGEKTLTYNIIPGIVNLRAYRSGGKIILKWDAVKGAEKYQIYYTRSGGKYKKLCTVKGNTTEIKLSGAEFRKYNFDFTVRAVAEDDGELYYGAFSEEVKVRIK